MYVLKIFKLRFLFLTFKTGVLNKMLKTLCNPAIEIFGQEYLSDLI